MGENLRRNIPLTRTNLNSCSNSDSSVTVDCLDDFSSHRCGDGKPVQKLETQWTDEKHSLYLDSLEASFVNELQHSRCLHDWCSQDNKCVKPPNSCNSSHQLAVLQNGCWQKINLKRNEPLLDSTADSSVTLKSPRISHSTCASKCCTVASPGLQEDCNEDIHLIAYLTASCEPARISKCLPESHKCHHNSVSSTAEIWGQNFVDNADGEMLSCTAVHKRLKTVVADSSCYDQVVPFSEYHSSVSAVNTGSLTRVEQLHCG